MSRRRGLTVAAALAVLIGVSLLLGSALSRPGSSSSASPLLGRHAPALAGTTLGGGTYRLPRKPGRLTLVNIWASWCGPCRQELPLLSQVARHAGAEGVRLVTVNTKDGEVPARELLRKVGASDLLTVQDPHGRLAVEWGVTGVPETFVVDAGGVVRARFQGPVSQAWLDQQIQRWGPR